MSALGRSMAADPFSKPPPAPTLRDRVLYGASIAFGELGFHATRVEDILRAASISRPSFYQVFKSKLEVFEALLDAHHAEIEARVRAAMASSDDPIEKAARAFEAFLRWRAHLGPIGRVLDATARAPDSPVTSRRRSILDMAVRLYEEAIGDHAREPIDPLLVEALIVGGESLADSLSPDEAQLEEEIARRVGIHLRLASGALGLPLPSAPPGRRRHEPLSRSSKRA